VRENIGAVVETVAASFADALRYHPSPHHSSFPTSKLCISQVLPSIDIHLAHLRTDFTDTRTALRLCFSVSVFFLVPVIVISFLFSFSISGLLSLP